MSDGRFNDSSHFDHVIDIHFVWAAFAVHIYFYLGWFGEVIVMKIVNKNFVQEVLLDLVSYRGCRSTYRSTYRSIVVPMVTEVCR